MSHVSWYEYLGMFGVSLVLTLGLTPLALRVAVRREILDHPGENKAQESPVPYLGGAAIVMSFAAAVVVAAILRGVSGGLDELLVILGVAVGLAGLGLVDDLRGLSPWFRLAVESAAGLVVWASDAGAALTGNAIVDAGITVVWIVAVTNAVNLLDNMDGLSAGVAAIASFFIFAMAAHNGQFLVATLAVGLGGCALGFLRSNFHPARIYMGDAGSLFLGFMLAVLSLKLRFENGPPSIVFAVPILLLGIPLFDAALVTVNRLAHGRSPLSGGRDHTSHRIVFLGIPVPATVRLIYLAATSIGVLAVVLSRSDRNTGLLLLGWLAGVAALIGLLLSRVPVYETSKRRHMMFQEVAKYPDDHAQVHGRPQGEATAADIVHEESA